MLCREIKVRHFLLQHLNLPTYVMSGKFSNVFDFSTAVWDLHSHFWGTVDTFNLLAQFQTWLAGNDHKC